MCCPVKVKISTGSFRLLQGDLTNPNARAAPGQAWVGARRGELALHGEMLRVWAGGGWSTTNPASPQGAQPLAGSDPMKTETEAVRKKLPEQHRLSEEHALISTHRRQTLQRTKGKRQPLGPTS